MRKAILAVNRKREKVGEPQTTEVPPLDDTRTKRKGLQRQRSAKAGVLHHAPPRGDRLPLNLITEPLFPISECPYETHFLKFRQLFKR